MLNGMGNLPSTDVINGIMVPVTPGYSIFGSAYGPAPIQFDTYAAQPTTPPFAGPGNSGAPAGYSAGGDTANNTLASAAHANPFNLKVSPLVWSVLMLVVGLAGLRMIHWG